MSGLGFFASVRANTDGCHMVPGHNNRFHSRALYKTTGILSAALPNAKLTIISVLMKRHLSNHQMTVKPQSRQQLLHFS